MIFDQHSIGQALLRTSLDILDEAAEPAITLDLTSLSGLSTFCKSDIERWCRMQPCPIVGIGHDGYASKDCTDAISRCVDVVVNDTHERQRLFCNLQRYPAAATVLVLVLRTTEAMPAADALVVESLAYATLQSGREFALWLEKHRSGRKAHLPIESGEALLLERNDDELTLILNRPLSRNAYTVEMRNALVDAFQWVNLDASIHRVSVSANGPCFSIGGELSEFGHVENATRAHLIRSQTLPASYLLPHAERYHFHVHKACIGSGFELPAFAGRFTAAPDTFFWLPELTMGLIPGAGGCVSISRRIGRRRTAHLVLLNKKINAETALRWGLIDAITPSINRIPATR